MTNAKDGGEFAGLNEEINNASAALQAFADGPARRAADEVAASFERAGQRIARSLGRAAFDGELSFKRLAKVILEELAKVVLSNVFSAGKGPFFGARANGGTVNAGGAYLVGERGPEWFVPHQSAAIAPQAGSGVSVHFHLGAGADANAIARHQGQIAAAIARAVAYGRRNL